jgi:hypothetical protein
MPIAGILATLTTERGGRYRENSWKGRKETISLAFEPEGLESVLKSLRGILARAISQFRRLFPIRSLN